MAIKNTDKQIALIYMGGTFGCVGKPLRPMPADDFLAQLTELLANDYPAMSHFTASQHIRDSSQLQPQDWIDLIQQIQDLAQQGFSHFLLIHGTDTLAYTAAILAEFQNDLFNNPLVHILITGSQHALLSPDGHSLNTHSDALDNLSLAYQALCKLKQNLASMPLKGSCQVAFDGQIWSAQSVQKIHTSATPAFTGSALIDSAATNTDSKAIGLIQLKSLTQLNIATYYALPLAPEIVARQLQQLLLGHPQAIIILAFGAGNLMQHAAIEQALEQAWQQQVVIVLGTQVPFGGVNFNYAASHWLGQFGVLSAGNLSLATIYARLAWLFCQPIDMQQRQQLWQNRLNEFF